MKHNGEHQERSPEHILREIEHTRSEMDSTLTAIEHRLTPGQLIDQGLDYLKGSGANEFVHNLGGQVKNNPMPIALVGIGIAWLMASGRNQSSAYSSSYSAYQPSGPSMTERAGEMKDKLTGRVGETTQAMRDRASGAMDSARGAMDSARSSLRSASQRVSDLGDSARQQMERARGGMDYMMREQPLALGAIGLAVGALMAAMAPRTQKEDELMGEARDRLVDRAKEVGQEKLEDAKQVANAAMSTATKEAEKRGMTPSTPLTSTDTAAKAQPAAKPSINPKPVSGTGTGTGSGTGTGKPGGTRNIP